MARVGAKAGAGEGRTAKAGKGGKAGARPAAKPAAKPTMAAKRAAFLTALRATLNVSAAARAAEIGNSTVYRHRQTNAKFRAAWDAALTEAVDDVESNMLRRAIEGVEKPVFYRGQQVGTIRTYSDALAMFLLKAKRPEVYARLTVGGAGGETVVVEAMSGAAAKAAVFDQLDRIAAAETEAGSKGAGSKEAGSKQAGPTDGGVAA